MKEARWFIVCVLVVVAFIALAARDTVDGIACLLLALIVKP